MQENKQEKSPIKQRILLYLGEKGVSMYDCYAKTGITRGILGQNNGISEDNLSRFLAYYTDVNIEWLVSGRGSMLRDSKTSEEAPMDYGTEKVQSSRHSKNPEESKLGVTPIATPISPAEESIIYKMYKDEKEEKERLVKEKESKIDHLQSELRSMAEELAALKAKYPESTTDKPVGLGSSETAPHAPSHPHSPTSEHYHGGSLPPQENQ